MSSKVPKRISAQQIRSVTEHVYGYGFVQIHTHSMGTTYTADVIFPSFSDNAKKYKQNQQTSDEIKIIMVVL